MLIIRKSKNIFIIRSSKKYHNKLLKTNIATIISNTPYNITTTLLLLFCPFLTPFPSSTNKAESIISLLPITYSHKLSFIYICFNSITSTSPFSSNLLCFIPISFNFYPNNSLNYSSNKFISKLLLAKYSLFATDSYTVPNPP